MKKLIIVLLMLTHSFLLKGQDSSSVLYRTEFLEDINLKFELPSEFWTKAKLVKTKNGSKIYTYTRELSGQKKKNSQASFSVFVEHVKPSTSIKDYSLKSLRFFEQQKEFKLKKAFTDSDGRFSIPYTVGYDAEYADEHGTMHHLYILHTIEFNHAAQLLIDFPFSSQELYEDEQAQILKSLRYERN